MSGGMRSTLRSLYERGLVAQLTHSNVTIPVASVYCGFDPTADALHLGNLVQIMALRHLQIEGWKPVVLIGGATGRIGDPSGKKEERKLLDEVQIESNVKALTSHIANVLDMECETLGAKVVNNYDWHGKMTGIDLLRETGRHFRVNAMLSKESVKRRMESEQGISFLEFSYQLFQAYDFMHLFQHENCTLQIGGSDQWGNITAGCELVRKALGKEVYGATLPLLTTSTGEKYGKSAGNAIWLDESKTSCYDFYQYFLRSTDEDISQLLHTFTFLSKYEIKDIVVEHTQHPEKRIGQQFLAESVTRLIHGPSGLHRAEQATGLFFGGSLLGLSSSEIIQAMSTTPLCQLPRDKVLNGSLVDLAVLSGICTSKGKAKRLLEAGGLYLNNERISDVHYQIEESHFIDKELLLLRTGRKTYQLIQII